jgi:lysophospholipase L1-like esterase
VVLAPLVALALVGLPAAAGPSVAQSSDVQAYFFGDSLMNGTGANPRRPVMARVAAARLGWQVQVDAWGGTGYTTTGRSPGYLDRLRLPGAMAGTYDVVLLEGGTNDARNAGDPEAVTEAVHAVVDEVQRRQPQALVVLMGAYDPPPPGLVDPRRSVVDALVAEVAAERGLPFFSPLSGAWTEGQGPSFLTADRLHPSTRGYGVMGTRLAQELGSAVERAGASAPTAQLASTRP